MISKSSHMPVQPDPTIWVNITSGIVYPIPSISADLGNLSGDIFIYGHQYLLKPEHTEGKIPEVCREDGERGNKEKKDEKLSEMGELELIKSLQYRLKQIRLLEQQENSSYAKSVIVVKESTKNVMVYKV